MSTSAVDAFLVYQFLKRLALPFEDWPAFRDGVIDRKGQILVPSDKRTSAQNRSFQLFDILVRNLKLLLARVPGGDTQFASVVAAMVLLKESRERTFDWEDTEMVKRQLFEELGGAPTNCVGSSAMTGSPIAGLDGKLGRDRIFRKKLRRRRPLTESVMPLLPQMIDSIAHTIQVLQNIDTQALMHYLQQVAPKDGGTLSTIAHEMSAEQIKKRKRQMGEMTNRIAVVPVVNTSIEQLQMAQKILVVRQRLEAKQKRRSRKRIQEINTVFDTPFEDYWASLRRKRKKKNESA